MYLVATFVPTHLYIKRHNKTGLLYFGKTSGKDPTRYKGSGNYWKDHLRIHGNDVSTVWHELFTTQEDLVEFAMFFSEVHNIVDAKDTNGKKIWANLIQENGLDGIPLGTKRSEEVLARLKGHTPWNKGLTKDTDDRLLEFSEFKRANPSPNKGIPKPEYHKQNQRKPKHAGHGSKVSAARKGKIFLPRITRICDRREMDIGNFNKWVKRQICAERVDNGAGGLLIQ